MHEVEIVIVGAGPSGLSAAIEASNAGAQVVLCDENSKPGGQLFKQIHKFFGSKNHYAGIRGIDIGYKLLEEVKACKAEVMLDSPVWGIFHDRSIRLTQNNKTIGLRAKRILLSTGAKENMISFPGWTLPGIMGAGAIQTLVNVHRVLPGNRILMVGSGNVGLIVSYQLQQAGANVLAVVEAAPTIGGYAVHAAKVRRGGTPIFTSSTVKEARGINRVEFATLVKLDENLAPIPESEQNMDVDIICLACGLSPLAELSWMAGCEFAFIPRLGGCVPIHDENMQSTVEGIYVAGDIAGIEEASTAMEEGRLAGIAMAESLGHLNKKKANDLKMNIRNRIDQLRAGPFGEFRKKDKQLLLSGGIKTWHC